MESPGRLITRRQPCWEQRQHQAFFVSQAVINSVVTMPP